MHQSTSILDAICVRYPSKAIIPVLRSVGLKNLLLDCKSVGSPHRQPLRIDHFFLAVYPHKAFISHPLFFFGKKIRSLNFFAIFFEPLQKGTNDSPMLFPRILESLIFSIFFSNPLILPLNFRPHKKCSNAVNVGD